MSNKYGVSSSRLTPSIYVGKLNSAGSAFTNKENCTDDALLSVALYVLNHFNGGMIMTFEGHDRNVNLEVRVTEGFHD